LLVFTDGLYKVENPCADAFSVDSLRDAIQQRAGLPLAKLMQDVFSEIETFAEGEAFPDDVCLVGMEIARLEIQPGKSLVSSENGFQTAAKESSRMALAGHR
jgi:hypothetical protein